MSPSASPPTAREVAKQLDRRQTKRRVTVWTLLLGLIAAAAAYLRCGDGFGVGGGGKGSGDGGSATQIVAGKPRCLIRLTGTGITVDGTPMSRDGALAACKAFGSAEIFVTGDARQGDGPELATALKAAGVADVIVRDRDPSAGSAKP